MVRLFNELAEPFRIVCPASPSMTTLASSKGADRSAFSMGHIMFMPTLMAGESFVLPN
jgi:hypothetical protein